MRKLFVILIIFYSIQGFSQSAEPCDNNIYDSKGLELQPEPPVGLNESLLKAGLEKKQTTKAVSIFVVEKDGSLSDIKVYGKTDSRKSAEIIRILKSSPNWKPGKQNGKLVRVRYAIPFD